MNPSCLSSFEDMHKYINPLNQRNLLEDIKINISEKNINRFLLEKDKQINQLANLSKNLNNQIESLLASNKAKNTEILTCKRENALLINELENYKRQNLELKNYITEKDFEINNKNKTIFDLQSKNDTMKLDMNNVFDSHLKDYEQVIITSQNLENEISHLKQKNMESQNLIIQQEQAIFELKKENLSINKLSNDNNLKNQVIDDLNFRIKEQIQKNEELTLLNTELNQRIQTYIKDQDEYTVLKQNLQNYEVLMNNLKKTYEIKIDEQDKSIRNLQEKIGKFSEDKNNLVCFMVGQMNAVQNALEKMDEHTAISDKNVGNNSSRDDTQELIKQNFEILLKNLMLLRKEDIKYILDLKQSLEEEKIKTSNILSVSENQKLINEETNRKNISIQNQLEDKSNEISNLNDKLTLYLKQNEELIHDKEILQSNLNQNKKILSDFYNTFITDVTNFYSHNIQIPKNEFPLPMLPTYSVMSPSTKIIEDLYDTFHILLQHIDLLTNNIICSVDKIKEMEKNINQLKEHMDVFQENIISKLKHNDESNKKTVEVNESAHENIIDNNLEDNNDDNSASNLPYNPNFYTSSQPISFSGKDKRLFSFNKDELPVSSQTQKNPLKVKVLNDTDSSSNLQINPSKASQTYKSPLDKDNTPSNSDTANIDMNIESVKKELTQKIKQMKKTSQSVNSKSFKFIPQDRSNSLHTAKFNSDIKLNNNILQTSSNEYQNTANEAELNNLLNNCTNGEYMKAKIESDIEKEKYEQQIMELNDKIKNNENILNNNDDYDNNDNEMYDEEEYNEEDIGHLEEMQGLEEEEENVEEQLDDNNAEENLDNMMENNSANNMEDQMDNNIDEQWIYLLITYLILFRFLIIENIFYNSENIYL